MNFSRHFRRNIALFLIALAGATGWNALNIKYLKKGSPASLRDGITVFTADDASYLRPPLNWLQKGEWRDNGGGSNAVFRRTPGYGFIYGILTAISNEQTALWLLVALQLLLFAGSALVLFQLLEQLEIPLIRCWAGFILYAIFPWGCGFLSYTLTEGIVPALIIFSASLALAVYRSPKNIPPALLLGLALGSTLLVRPIVMALLASAFPAFWRTNLRGKLLILGIPLLVWGGWIYRNYEVTGDYSGFHGIYSADSPTMYRAPHKALTDLYKVWNTDPSFFHRQAIALWDAGRDTTTAFTLATRLHSEWPAEFNANDTEAVAITNALEAYRRAAGVVEDSMASGKPPHHLLSAEKRAVWRIRKTTRLLISGHPLQFWVLTPIKSAQKLLFESNLNMYLFQKQWRGEFWVELLRLFLVLLQPLLWLFSFSVLLLPKHRDAFWGFIKWIVLGAILYLLFLAFYQRMNETRYMLPSLPLIIISGFYGISSWSRFLKSKFLIPKVLDK